MDIFESISIVIYLVNASNLRLILDAPIVAGALPQTRRRSHDAKRRTPSDYKNAAQNDPSKLIEDLQEKALALESETAYRKQLEQELHTIEERDRFLAAVVDQSDDAIITKSLQGIVTSWNKGAERIFGYSASEMVGKPITLLIPDDRQDEEPNILARLRRGERVDHFETVRRRKNGSLLDISLTISPVRDAGGKIIGASKIARDITELRRAREAMSRTNEELERRVAERTASLREALAQMEEFSYSVSHDLRAPVRAMQGFARALQEDCYEALDPMGREYIERIIAGGNKMQRLIQDILDYSRVGRSEMTLRRVPLGNVVRELIAQEPAFAPHRARIKIHQQLPDVMGHPLSVGQVISNLLRNAVKFVGPGVIPEVLISAETSNGHTKVSVTDNGIGIPPQFHPKLFGLFRRLHSNDQYEGTGVGLAITRKAVERMGGKIGVESDGVHGSTFWFTLPAAPGTKPENRSARP